MPLQALLGQQRATWKKTGLLSCTALHIIIMRSSDTSDHSSASDLEARFVDGLLSLPNVLYNSNIERPRLIEFLRGLRFSFAQIAALRIGKTANSSVFVVL